MYTHTISAPKTPAALWLSAATSTRWDTPRCRWQRTGSFRSARAQQAVRFSKRNADVRAQGGGDEDDEPNSEDATGSLFAQELAKRGYRSGDARASTESAEDLLNRAAGRGPPKFAEGGEDDQLKKSRALNAEGLEGFPARAKELLKLGTSFFLSFGPLVGATIALAAGTYLVFGEEFIHQGPYEGYGAPPPYVEPYALLNEPTVDRMVPLITPESFQGQ